MCGLVGLVRANQSGTTEEFKKFMHLLLLVDQIRGYNSTGFFAVHEKHNPKKDDPICYKKALNATDFLDLPFTQKMLSDLRNLTVFAGHNRYATKGHVINSHAHPFNVGKITLMHNGTINYFGKYNTEMKNVPVDSLALTALIDQHGMIPALKEVSGAYALVFYDGNDDSLNIIRNPDRPLFLAKTPFGYAWASEAWMLYAAAAFSGVKINELAEIPEYTLHKFSIERTKTLPDVTLHITSCEADLKKVTPIYPGTHHNSHGGRYTDHYKKNNNPLVVVPGATQIIHDPEKILKKLGVKRDEIVEIDIDEFQGNSDKGIGAFWGNAFGSLVEDPNVPVMCSQIPREFYEMLEEGGNYHVYGRVLTGFRRPDHRINSRVETTEYLTIMDVYAEEEDKASNTMVKIVPSRSSQRGESITVTMHPIITHAEKARIDNDAIAQAVAAHTGEDVIEFPTVRGGKRGVLASLWALRKGDGCSYCTANIDETNAFVTTNSEFLCEDCATNPAIPEVAGVH